VPPGHPQLLCQKLYHRCLQDWYQPDALRHEKSYPRVGCSPFFSAHRNSQLWFPEAARMLFGSRKGLHLVVGRVRFLVKQAFFAGSLFALLEKPPARQTSWEGLAEGSTKRV
jgi:hypothetical protein